jgi:hypothetical protein
MAFAIIRPQTAVAKVEITPAGGSLADWTQVFQRGRVRSNLPQIDATTYSTEASGQFIGGVERLTFEMGGLQTKGAPASGPLLPLSAYQAALLNMQYDTGCSISATVNATDGGTDRPAGAMGLIDAVAVSTGSFTVTWVKV